MNGEAEKLMICYMQEVYRRIRENNSAMLTDGKHWVYIATPSGWDKQTQDLYLQNGKTSRSAYCWIDKGIQSCFCPCST